MYSQLKGLPEEEAIIESEKMQEDLNLTEKKNFKSRYLSGGMKRKLSIGIALCGGSKVCFFDKEYDKVPFLD